MARADSNRREDRWEKAGSRRERGKVFALVSALVILGSIAAYLYIQGERYRIPTDPTTLCPTDRPPSEVIVVLLDMSEGFSEPQRLKIENELQRLENRMNRFALIEVYTVDRLGQRVTTPVLRLCNPGTGDDLNRFYQNPELARKKWSEFIHKLDLEVKRLLAAPKSPESPIFEAVQSIALRTFNLPLYEHVPKRLIIVSDLLQNVPGKLSQYVTEISFGEFKNSAYFSNVRSDLKQVDVTLLYLVRPNTPQKWPEHYRFWEEYFVSQGATVQLLEPVYGAE